MTEIRPRISTFHGPLYAQLADVIRDEIATGRWRIGSILPNELDMAQTYDVSVGTMRRALALLSEEKMIRRSRGRGTEIIASHPNVQRSVFKSNPANFHSEDVNVMDQPAPTVAAGKLGVATGDIIKLLSRTIAFDDKSRAIDSVYLTKSVFKKVQHVDMYSNRELEHAYQAIEPSNRLIANEWISTEIARSEMAATLKVPSGTQVLKVTRLLSLGDAPVEYSEMFLNLDGVAYSLGRQTSK